MNKLKHMENTITWFGNPEWGLGSPVILNNAVEFGLTYFVMLLSLFLPVLDIW